MTDTPNVEFVRSFFADRERGDFFSRLDRAHPNAELVVADGPLPGHWKGLAAATQAWRDVLSAWENVRIFADEYHELDEERVLVLFTTPGTAGQTGWSWDR